MVDFKGNISGQKISIGLGDLTSEKCESFIVPQSDRSLSYGGVGGAIIRSGAESGMNAYQDQLEKHGPFNFGDAYLTESGGGNSKYLLHVVTVGSPRDEQFSTIQKAFYNALTQAQARGIKTVAAPALGTGIVGLLTPTQSAKAMLSAVNQFAKAGGAMDEIKFVIRGTAADQAAFTQVLEEKSFAAAAPEVGQKKFDFEKFGTKMREDIRANSLYRARD